MSTDSVVFETHGEEETIRLGERLAALLPSGSVVALRGDLAAGKTCFVRGMAKAYGDSEAVSSPTFTLVNEYVSDGKLYHLDLYRLDSLEEIMDLGYEELFEPADGVTVIEWAERAERLLPERRVDISFEHGGEDLRRIRITNNSVLDDGWEYALESHAAPRA